MIPLLWADVETSGFNPASNNMLEIGLVATDEYLNIEGSISYLIKHDKIFWREKTLDFHKQHNPTLLRDLPGALHYTPAVEERLVKWVEDTGVENRPLAGSSPQGVDKPFIRHQMPLLNKLFHRYRMFDARSVYTALGHEVDTIEDRSHRALDDCFTEIARMKKLLKETLRVA